MSIFTRLIQFFSSNQSDMGSNFNSLCIEINSLQLNQVKNFINDKVTELGDEYVQTVLQGSDFFHELLSKSSVDFYKQYEVFDVLKSDLILNTKEIGASEYLDSYMRIGRDIGFAEIVSKNNEDAVFYLDFIKDEEYVLDQRMESIWHYLLVNLIMVYPFLYDDFKQMTDGE